MRGVEPGVFPRTRRSGVECADTGLGHRQVLAPDADDRGDLSGCRAVKNVTPWTIFGGRGPGGSRTGSVVGVAMFPPSISRRTSKYVSWQGTEDVCAFWVIRCIGPRKSLYLQGGLHVA